MPKTTFATTTVFTPETLTKAAALADDAYSPLWTGPSGEESSGEAVARHLEATITLLEKDGRIRAHDYGADWSARTLPAADDEATVAEMVRSLLDLIREEETSRGPGRTVATALNHIGGSEHGDPDTRDIAQDVLTLLVQALTGSDRARFAPWSERLTRTHADITASLTAAAHFARTYGPSTAGVSESAA